MSICWHCYHGWPKVVADIYDAAVEKLGQDSSVLHFGPSHIVWEDENWEDRNIEFCLKLADEEDYSDRFSQKEIDICKWSLQELLKIPHERRDYEPEDYDGEHPENFPPPPSAQMIKR